MFTAAFGWVSKQQNVSTPVEEAHHGNADSIPRCGVPCVPRAGLHGHGLGIIVCLGESCGRVYWSTPGTEALACMLGFVSDAHRNPCLRSEEPRRSLLDVLDRNAVRECVVDWLEKTAGTRAAAAGVHHSSRVRERLGHASAVRDVCEYVG